MPEDVGNRLDGRHAVVGGFAPDFGIEARLERRQAQPWQRGQRGIGPQQLLRLPPGAVEHDEGDGRGEVRRFHIDGGGAWEKNVRVSRCNQLAYDRVAAEVDVGAQNGARQAQASDARGPDAHIAFARVLQITTRVFVAIGSMPAQ